MSDLQWYVCTPQGPYPVARDDERMAGWEGMALVFYTDHVAALAACEERVRVEKMADTEGHIRSVGRLEGHRAGYARALDDAALAVERGCAHTKYENCYPCWHDQYAEKIRALQVKHD